jgi:hypothetical protein
MAVRFCLKVALDPNELLRNLTAVDVKAQFDCIKDKFRVRLEPTDPRQLLKDDGNALPPE